MLYQLSYASMMVVPTIMSRADTQTHFWGTAHHHGAAFLRLDPLKVKGIGAHSPEDGGSQAFRSFLGSTNTILPTQFASFSRDRWRLQSGLSRHPRKQ